MPEEKDRDEAAGEEAHGVVNEPVVFDGLADFELHHGNAGKLRGQPRTGEIGVHRFVDVVDGGAQFIALGDLGRESENDQGELAVLRQKLAANDLIGHHAVNQLAVGGAFRQLIWKQRRRNLVFFLGLARREHRDYASRAIDQLKVYDEVSQFFDRVAREQVLAFDDDEHVEFARRKSPRHLLVLFELGRIRAEQLTERIVDFDPRDAKGRGDHQRDRGDRDDPRMRQGQKADALEAEGDRMQLPLVSRGALLGPGDASFDRLFQRTRRLSVFSAQTALTKGPAARGQCSFRVPSSSGRPGATRGSPRKNSQNLDSNGQTFADNTCDESISDQDKL